MSKIRQINGSDEGKVKDLIMEVMGNEFSDSANAFSIEDIQKPMEYYGGSKEMFFVAEDNGEIVGTVGIKNDTDYTALLRRLFVKKDFRGKGLGSKLIHEAMEFCKKHGYKKVMFRGTDAMKAAIKTCLKNGFKEHDILVLPHVKMIVLERGV